MPKPMNAAPPFLARPRSLLRWDFQDRVRHWCLVCFGLSIADDRMERNHRHPNTVVHVLHWLIESMEQKLTFEQRFGLVQSILKARRSQ